MPGSLSRVLTVRDLSLLVVGTVIGSGIFLVPAVVLRETGGSVFLALAVWVVAGVLSVLGALTYAELGAMSPQAGGLYVYLRDAYGPLVAFLFGWTLFFVMGSGSVATLCVAFAAYLGQLVPVSPLSARLVPIVIIVALAVLNVRGTRQSATLLNLWTGIKLAALVVMSLLLLLRGDGVSADPPAPLGPPTLSGIGVALVAVLWAYEGWTYVTFSAGEAADPQRGLPRGILYGTATIVGVYLLANLAYLAALGPARAAASPRIAAEAVSAVLGPGAGRLIAAAILVSMFSAAHAITLTAPRVFFAMARDGVFFRRLGEVDPRFGTPAFAILTSSAWAIALAASGTFEQLLTYVVFTAWIFYALGALAVLRFRRTRPGAERPFRVPGYPWTPLLFALAAVAIVVSTVVGQPARAALGLGVVLAGTPAFWLWRRGSASDAARVTRP